MKLVFASDSFKGSLTSKKISEILSKASKDVFGECDIVPLVLADGGEGTLDAVLEVTGGRRVPVTVHDPLMNEITAYYGSLDNGTALIEMAQASGLTLVPKYRRNPLNTSSIGTGELIRAALEAGHRELIIAIGGSATNDGGMGAAKALGICFCDASGKELDGRGKDLRDVSEINTDNLLPEIKQARISVMCDVNNPLCGTSGASRVFSPQKGADEEIVEALEEGMKHYRRIITDKFGVDPDTIAGAGAAGGMGAALKIFFNAELKSGIETLLDLCGFDRLIEDADVIITGEGRLDGQSSGGKAVQGVGIRAKKAGVPCIALCGCLGDGYESIMEYGITQIKTLTDDNTDKDYAIEHAEEVYYRKAAEVMQKYNICDQRERI